jgi:hypothetical protein
MREHAQEILEDAKKQYIENIQSKVEISIQRSQFQVKDN